MDFHLSYIFLRILAVRGGKEKGLVRKVGQQIAISSVFFCLFFPFLILGTLVE